MSSAFFQFKPLEATHDRKRFDCASEQLNRYLKEQVTQDIRRRIATCFVALDNKQRIAGYYTLASASVLLANLPESLAKRLPRYPTVPAVRVGRLAVDQAFERIGLGGLLLADAISRTISSEIATHALIVEAKNDVAASFYRHYGFLRLRDSPLNLFLPLAAARIHMAKKS